MSGPTALKPECEFGGSVTLVTQAWEIDYPNYPALCVFYNSGAFLYSYSRRNVQP
jgi:hypothetical protein